MKAVNTAVTDVRNADFSLEQCTVIIMVYLFFPMDRADFGGVLRCWQQVVQEGERREGGPLV
jgi:hypothetical protein